MTSNPPPAAVDRAVAEAKAWGVKPPTEFEAEVFAMLDAGDTAQEYGLDELEGAYALGFLAHAAELERLRSALRAILDAEDFSDYTDAIEHAKTLLTTPEPQ